MVKSTDKVPGTAVRVATADVLEFDLRQLRERLARDARHLAKEFISMAENLEAGYTPSQVNGFEVLAIVDCRAEIIAKEQALMWLREENSNV